MSTADVRKTKLDKTFRALLPLRQEAQTFKDRAIVHALGIVDQFRVIPVIFAEIRIQAV